jgi:hypothetical protein
MAVKLALRVVRLSRTLWAGRTLLDFLFVKQIKFFSVIQTTL